MTYEILDISKDVGKIPAAPLKRIFDAGLSLLALILLCPILVLIALAIALTSPGHSIYRAKRVGRNGRIFEAYKFRSMVVNADTMGPGVTVQNDPRITSVGRVLRRTKLDELPQLINVLRGEMSLVGPRPETPEYVCHYTPEHYRVILSVRPGITSPASIAFRHEEELLSGVDWEQRYIETILPTKLAIDMEYARCPTVMKDIKILFQTIRALFQ